MDISDHGCDLFGSMRLGDPLDPALEAATLALSGRKGRPASRFASIELRMAESRWDRWAPAGYLASGVLGVVVVAILWAL
ncbi:MAG TPA: hypothetical protein VLC09_03555 [Polyangiaceae bacterium]|nr:hypothetical protein [Polyangiaceae bacterium]